MSNLRVVLNQLANAFASNVLDAIRGASLQEILAESGGSSGSQGSVGRGHGGIGYSSASASAPVRRGPGRPPGSTAKSSFLPNMPGHPNAGAAVHADMPSPYSSRGRRRGRLARRSAGDISQIVDSIVELLERRTEGLRAEQIRAELNLEAKELPRPIAEALASRRINKQGQKRATTYFARGNGGSGKPARGGRASAAAAGPAKRGPGRPAGSKNKKPGRPPGSKNKKSAGRRKSEGADASNASTSESSS